MDHVTCMMAVVGVRMGRDVGAPTMLEGEFSTFVAYKYATAVPVGMVRVRAAYEGAVTVE